MSIAQIIGAVIGFLIIALTLWKIVRYGVAKSNGKGETFDPTTGRNTEWLGDGF